MPLRARATVLFPAPLVPTMTARCIDQREGYESACAPTSLAWASVLTHEREGSCEERVDPWQEWQGSAFARVRSRSVARSETLAGSSLSERARTGANIARICHAERRRFESHHALQESPANPRFLFIEETKF